MPTLINTRLSEGKGGKPRIWMEGGKLAREGIEPGMKYDLIEDKNSVSIKFTETGTFAVNKRTNKHNGTILPLIEIRDKLLLNLFKKNQKLRVVVKQSEIIVTAHFMDAKIKERVERFMNNMIQGKPQRFGSCFHGGGGLDKSTHNGLKLAGIKSIAGVVIEKESPYLESSLRNNPELFDKKTTVIHSEIQDVLFTSKPSQMDIAIMGIPCESSSISGRSKNGHWGGNQAGGHAESHSKVGAMFYYALEFIRNCNASVVILENVEPYSKTASADIIRSMLTEWGYNFAETTLTGTDYGSLEKRSRWALVAISKGFENYGLNISDLDLSNILPLRQKPQNLGCILQDVPLDTEATTRWKRGLHLEEKEKRDAANGKGFRRQLLEPLAEFCGTIGKSYAKIRSTEPMLKHPDYETNKLFRIFTAVEHCLIKGFDPSFIRGNSETTAHEILGQSVCYGAFEALAYAIGKWFMKSEQIDLPLVA
ncbi:DNA cytosine methyltransferase [Vibrio tubiashii]|uniref:DNA cytosine methyltransferase n=1 Tax=Vibrio tubiashii TaxID=29498 RepID=UPI001EFCEDBE|nr:DNA cytosine methyltransferase [Vibrio tubiashii]MCG9579074.1 DNA cytosine methyltransferase [Vibrio tubiashii]